jgi:predicted transcriptional regulator
MAKEKEIAQARRMYVDMGKTAKYIAEKLGLTEKTVGKWVKEYNWKNTKVSKTVNSQNRIENILAIIDSLVNERLNNMNEIATLNDKGETGTRIKDLRDEIARIDNSIAIQNKTLSSFRKELAINPLVFMQTLDIIINELIVKHPEFMSKANDFHEYMLKEMNRFTQITED